MTVPLPAVINDPPPPYPRERRARTARAGRRLNSQHIHLSSTESDYDSHTPPQPFPVSEEGHAGVEAVETTPLLSPTNGRNSVGRMGRTRTLSYTSTLLSSNSAAPSFAQTLVSLFQPEPDPEMDMQSSGEGSTLMNVQDHYSAPHCLYEAELRRRPSSWLSRRTWKTYFRPMTRLVYYKSLFHLLVLNFPFALAAWLYLFVFTLYPSLTIIKAGTTLLMALPLGAILCFLDLLGARTFARGELALQTHFHAPLAYPAPYPSRPIFTRLREPAAVDSPTLSSIESGMSWQPPQYETSFYRNTYAMFTDSTSYQALFYFLVIKPGIILLLLVLWVVVPVAFVLVLPAPAVLCAVRRLGIWQANVAVEGLYVAIS